MLTYDVDVVDVEDVDDDDEGAGAYFFGSDTACPLHAERYENNVEDKPFY